MKNYFYGWYLKCQSDSQTLAIIPSIHQTGKTRTCSIQIITNDNAWNIPFSPGSFRRKGMTISIGKNEFSKEGICLGICTPDLNAAGKLNFGPLSPLKYDIMGPFALIPFMECRHSVYSMQHSVCGTLRINNKIYSFENGKGYWEGDSGRSFPERYIWTQCSLPYGSLLLSVADIPIAGIHFTGIIGIILWKGNEYRFATYLGARLAYLKNKKIRILQGNLELEACLLEEEGHPLKAPINGEMTRIIHESVSCKAFYELRKNGETLFAFETKQASFEYECSFYSIRL